MEKKRQEILALCLMVMALLILLSLLSFDKADLTVFNASLSNRPPRNWIGSFGAHLAWPLIFLFGVGAYWLPGTALLLSWFTMRGRTPFANAKVQLLGIFLLFLGSITFAALKFGNISLFRQEIFAGGELGKALASLLRSRFNAAGTYILLTGLFLSGLILATPFSFQGAFTWLRSVLNSSKRMVGSLLARRQSPTIIAPESLVKPLPAPAKPVPPVKTVPQVGLLPAPTPADPHPIPRRQLAIELSRMTDQYALPPLELLDVYEMEQHSPDQKMLEANARILEEKLADFGVQGQVVGIFPGPVITMFEYVPAPGIKISRIVGLADDLSMALKAISIRVVAPIPGKAAIGIEVPNQHRQLVPIKAVLEAASFVSSTAPLTVALGKDIVGQPVVANLARMPHLLVAGATGTGKSVCINSLLSSLLYRTTPTEMRLLLIDPKRIELSSYEGIPHLLHPVVTDAKMATRALRWAVKEMELRYKMLAEKNARNIESYNKILAREQRERNYSDSGKTRALGDQTGLDHHHLPYLVLIIDELADLMMVASRDVEESIIRLAQMARAAGIHLVLATQRPSVDVITGIIKANISTRISFQVASRTDSRTILDANGAEALLGAGDMLFLPPGTAKLQRIHGAFISEAEVQRLTQFWREQQLADDPLRDRVDFADETKTEDINDDELDERYQEAVQIVTETRQASISMLQRRLRVGYNRAARMIEIMEQQGLVGPSDGIKPREVLGPGRSS